MSLEKTNLPALGEIEAPESLTPIERFDELMHGLKPMLQPTTKVHGRDMYMGSRSTPILRVGDEKIIFTVFQPRDRRSRRNYSKSILFQSLAYKQNGELFYPAAKESIRMRRKSLSDEPELDKLEEAYKTYREAAYKLEPDDARNIGFPNSFIRRLKISRFTRSLLGYSRTSES